MALTIYSRTKPHKFKSVALANALKNLGQIPQQLGTIGSMVTGEIKRNISGRYLNKRTGRLYNSWVWAVKSLANSLWRLTISSDVEYARIHNFGGFTGKNHATKIKATRYAERAMVRQLPKIRRVFRDYTATLWKG